MPSITYLSKNWTVESTIGYARGIVNQIAPDKLKRLQLIDYLNMAQCKLSIMLNGAKKPDYGKTLTVKNTAASADEVELVVDGSDVTLATADLSADVLTTKLRIDTLTKIRYVPATGSTKLAIEMNPIEFEGLKDNLPNNKEEVYWCLLGETLYIRNRITGIALEADWGSLLVFYNRYPVKLSVASADRLGDTLDARDGYARMLLDIMEIYIRAELDMKPSETNTQNLNALMNQIREASIAGTAATQDATSIS